jgi:hypothetical protein
MTPLKPSACEFTGSGRNNVDVLVEIWVLNYLEMRLAMNFTNTIVSKLISSLLTYEVSHPVQPNPVMNCTNQEVLQRPSMLIGNKNVWYRCAVRLSPLD